MTENEPLNESSQSNGKIVAIDNGGRLNGNNHANGKFQKSKALPMPEHIEAPCCRDIHGAKEPPDGGMRAWLVMISAFLCNGVIFGIINTYGVIHKLLTERLQEQGDTDASSKAALVGSLTIGTTFLLSPVAGCLTDKIGLRLTTLIGGILSSGGLLLSSFFTYSTGALYVTYGIMFGLGAALAYTPTLAILGHYFKRYLGKVSGFVTAGSSVFTVILPPGMDYLIKSYDLETTLRIMSVICTFVILCSFVYKPLHPPPAPPKKKPGRSKASMVMRSIINVEIWKRKKYVIWALCIPMALFGYFVPYVHMMKFVQMSYPNNDQNLPVMSIGITSGLGRLIFGAIADLPGVNRIYLQQLSLSCIGVVTILLPLTSSYVLLIVFSLIMGLFDGCFISLLGPIAYEICGPSGATQAIGFLLGLSSLPLTIGPPVAGIIFDKTGSYTIPLILAGIPPIIGSAILFLIRFIRDDPSLEKTNGVMVTANGTDANGGDNDEDVEKHLASKQIQPLMNGHSKAATLNGNGSVEHRPESETHDPAAANGKARLGDTDPLSVIHSHSEKYGPMMYTWLVTYPVLLITDPDTIRDIFTSPHCTKKSVLYKAITNGVGRGLFSSEDPEWSVHRKYLNPAFGHKILLSFIPIFNQEVNKILKLFNEMGECSDVVTLLQDFTLKIAIRTTMGVNADQEFGNGRNGNLIKSYQCVVENMTDILFAPWLANNLVRRVLGVYEPFNSCKAENRNFIRKLIANKLNGNGSDGNNADGSKNIFIDQAIELLRKNVFTPQHVEDESNTIVLGAFETTANTIGYVLILLAMFPEYQQKAYEELVSIFPEGGDFDVTYANIQDMIYMDMVLNESMRIMTPVPFVARENVKDMQLSNGIVIPAGIQFVVNIFTMHRRKDIWGAAADIFNPYNFLPSNLEGKHPYAFIPFTKGIRNCIGWKYGLMSAKVALAKLLRNFQFSTDFQYRDLEFYDSIVLKLKQIPVLRITRR